MAFDPKHDTTVSGDVTVAVVNTSPDTIDVLRRVLHHAGFIVVTGYVHDIRDGKLDLEAFMRQHDPTVVVYDISVPYDDQWRFFLHVRRSPSCQHRQFVITTTNAAQVSRLAGREDKVYEVVGKPYDLDQIVMAVKEAAKARPTK
jgi:CheY-like chemotaxis protein